MLAISWNPKHLYVAFITCYMWHFILDPDFPSLAEKNIKRDKFKQQKGVMTKCTLTRPKQ